MFYHEVEGILELVSSLIHVDYMESNVDFGSIIGAFLFFTISAVDDEFSSFSKKNPRCCMCKTI